MKNAAIFLWGAAWALAILHLAGCSGEGCALPDGGLVDASVCPPVPDAAVCPPCPECPVPPPEPVLTHYMMCQPGGWPWVPFDFPIEKCVPVDREDPRWWVLKQPGIPDAVFCKCICWPDHQVCDDMVKP